MFGRWFKTEKPRLFLTAITVVPSDEGMDDALQKELEGIFGNPVADEIPDLKPTDLGLEIYVPEYRLGDSDFMNAAVGDVGVTIPVMFRPKIELRARLFRLESGETERVFRIRRTMGVKKGLSRMFSIRGLMPGNTFTREDVQTLFMDACKDLIDELRPYQ